MGNLRDWLTTVQHQPQKDRRRAAAPQKKEKRKKLLDNARPNTHTLAETVDL